MAYEAGISRMGIRTSWTPTLPVSGDRFLTGAALKDAGAVLNAARF
jgi:hypothetical protein